MSRVVNILEEFSPKHGLVPFAFYGEGLVHCSIVDQRSVRWEGLHQKGRIRFHILHHCIPFVLQALLIQLIEFLVIFTLLDDLEELFNINEPIPQIPPSFEDRDATFIL
mmetsp:Transcript_6320/g.5648  ORF Transcript_6320/g.5648 Transcript_6320/m.5648 type:complete len:109 (-) Transcript_6320:859-1185(-)